MAHYYDRDGNPRYETNGKPTGLREARKQDLVQSVTEIINMQSNYGLKIYVQNQLLKAAYAKDPADFKTYKEWCYHTVKESNLHRDRAALNGSIVHDALEYYYKNGRFPHGNSPMIRSTTVIKGVTGAVCSFYTLKDALTPVVDFLNDKFPDSQWIAEKSFTNLKWGFAGKVDLHDVKNNIVLDFKTKASDDMTKFRAYDSHHMQTAAYAVGLMDEPNKTKRYNLFISTEKIGLLKLSKSNNFDREWGMFKHLNTLWQLSHKFKTGE